MVKPMVCGDLREVTLRHFGWLTVAWSLGSGPTVGVVNQGSVWGWFAHTGRGRGFVGGDVLRPGAGLCE